MLPALSLLWPAMEAWGITGIIWPTLAQLDQPYGVTADAAGNVYIGDQSNYRVRKVNTSGVITTFAGTGVAGYNGENIPATNAQLNRPTGTALDPAGNLYIEGYGDYRIRKVGSAVLMTGYYYKGTGDITSVTNWGINPDGSGTNPTTFADAGYTYLIANTTGLVNLLGNWSVGGPPAREHRYRHTARHQWPCPYPWRYSWWQRHHIRQRDIRSY